MVAKYKRALNIGKVRRPGEIKILTEDLSKKRFKLFRFSRFAKMIAEMLEI